jgi:hypothetical protein
MAFQDTFYIGRRNQMIFNVFDMLPAKEQKEMIKETKKILENQFQSMDEKIIKVLMGKTTQRQDLLEMVTFLDEYEIDQLLDEAMFNVNQKKWVQKLKEMN